MRYAGYEAAGAGKGKGEGAADAVVGAGYKGSFAGEREAGEE